MNKLYIYLLICGFGLMATSCGNSADNAATEDAETEVTTEEKTQIMGDVFFANLKDSQEISLPFVAEFGVNGLQVEPAGEKREGFGHHHLVIDGTFVPEGQVVPMNEKSIHYGKGQTSDTLKNLTPGMHTLTLQFADGMHLSYGEPLSKTISIKVK